MRSVGDMLPHCDKQIQQNCGHILFSVGIVNDREERYSGNGRAYFQTEGKRLQFSSICCTADFENIPRRLRQK